jgi:uncharacterized protein DUF4031
MTVYVDPLFQWPAARYSNAQAQATGAKNKHTWCHMFADEADCSELHAMAAKIGLRRSWFQGDHYDLTPGRRAAALAAGAKAVTREEAVVIWRSQPKRVRRAKVTYECPTCGSHYIREVTEPSEPLNIIVCTCCKPDRHYAKRKSVEML